MESRTAAIRNSEQVKEGELALQAMRRGVRNAFLDVTAYDPYGKGKAYWETHDESGLPIPSKKTS